MKGTDFLEAVRANLAVMEKLAKNDPQKPNLLGSAMFEGVGNLAAYNKAKDSAKGIHVRLDINNLNNGINLPLGWKHGTRAIKTFGESIKNAAGTGKVFHVGGDKFHVVLPDLQSAASFIRDFRDKLESTPPVGGVVPLAASIGIGEDSAGAEAGSSQAKAAMRQGQADQTYVHSTVSGADGAIPVNDLHGILLRNVAP